MSIENLKGKIITKIIKINSEEVHFYTECDKHYRMMHHQDCCESVYLEDVTGDLIDLIGSIVVISECESQYAPNNNETGTWTFYKFATQKGYVTFRWYGGESFYSVEVDFEEVK